MFCFSLSALLLSLLFLYQPDVANGRGNHLFRERITRSKGAAGAPCPGSRYKCAASAVCANEKCSCPPGTHGNPHLKCVPTDSYLTMVLADPKVVGFDNFTSHLGFPCKSLITHIETPHTMGKTGGVCSVKIYAFNHHVNEGFYLLGYDVEMTVTDFTKLRFSSRSTTRIFGYDDGGFFSYKEQVSSRSMRYRPWSLRYMDTMVKTRYEENDNLVIVESPACGLYTTFKGFVKYSLQMPGLLVAVKKAKQPVFPTALSPLSGTPYTEGTPDLIDLKHALKLTRSEMTLYQCLIQDTRQNFGVGSISCTVAVKEFIRMCRTKRERAFAIKTCGFFYLNPNVSKCIKMEEFGESSGSSFGMCSQSMCTGHGLLCEDIRYELRQYQCDAPAPFKDLNCFNIHQTMLDMYPYEIP